MWKSLLASSLLVLSAGAAKAQYCTTNLYTTGCVDDDYIQSVVSSGGSTNISTLSTGCSNQTSAYTYYSNQTLTATAGTATCSLTVAVGPYAETVYVYVDWNADGDFDDAGESVLSGQITAGGAGAGPLAVPAGTVNGTKRMRVRCVYGGTTTVTACSSETYGEVEDYNLAVTGGVAPCTAPGNLTASNVTATGATFNWLAPTGATGFQYVVDNSTANPTAGFQTATASPVTVSNLNPTTTYYFHLRTACSGSTFSSWVTTSFTTTVAPCLAPDSVKVTNNSNSATLTWPSTGAATGYEHANTTSVTPPTSGTATTSLTASYSGLTANTVYYAHVRSNCNGTFSPWQTQLYTTATTGIAGADQNGVRLHATPNPTNNRITLHAEGIPTGNAGMLTITDVAGRVLRSLNVTGKETEVSLADMPAGLYLLRYSSATHTGVTRVQKL